MFVQTKMVAWVLMTLAFLVVRFGADFTFQFAWISWQAGGPFHLPAAKRRRSRLPLSTERDAMDELQSVGVGIALGLVLVSFLAYHPGEPFDYTTDCGEKCSIGTERASSTTPSNSTNTGQIEPSTNQEQQRQIADIDRAAQRVKIQKLQELLGLEKEKAQQLVERAKEEAKNAASHGRTSSANSSSSNSVWLDRGFFIVMSGLLVWVLWQDYRIDLLSVAAHLFPREVALFQQVAAAPRSLLLKLSALWE